jgi:hypothetical protein
MLNTTGNFRSDSCPTTRGNIFGKAVLEMRAGSLDAVVSLFIYLHLLIS